MKGRKKLPQEVLNLRGTNQKCRERPKVPAVLKPVDLDFTSLLENDTRLSDVYSKEVFKIKVNFLKALGIMDLSYVDDIVTYANYASIRKDALDSLKKERFSPKYDISGKQIGFVRNPYFDVLYETTRQMNALGSKYGFSPIDRMKMPITEDGESVADVISKTINGK